MTKKNRETFRANRKRSIEVKHMIKYIRKEQQYLVKFFGNRITVLEDRAMQYEREVYDLAYQQWELNGFRGTIG